MAIDIDHGKRAEEALQQSKELLAESERLAATGRMAARVAHEINNPLAGIANSFQLVKRAVPKDHQHYEFTTLIEKEIDRIGRIVLQMFELYRPGQETIRDVSIQATIEEVIAMLEPSRRKHEVRVETCVDASDTTFRIPEGSLRQILFNLVENAIEASPPGGVVKITGTTVENEQGAVEEGKGTVARIAVTDQGAGIPEEARNRIFEPFFTTKRYSHSGGVGLGLSISRGIADSLGGSLDFESSPGKATTFRVILPSASP
jgi:signal transduction histidine kinase